MKMRLLLIIVSVVAAATTQLWSRATAADPARKLTLGMQRMYQPDSVFLARAAVWSIADGTAAIQRAFEDLTAGDWLPQVKGVVVAVAIRPGRKQRVWVDLVGADEPAEVAKLEARLALVPAPKVKGLVAYGLKFLRDGETVAIPGIPSKWQAVMSKAGKNELILDEVVEALWPQAAQHGVAPVGRPRTAARR